MSEAASQELENFRNKWREEVTARSRRKHVDRGDKSQSQSQILHLRASDQKAEDYISGSTKITANPAPGQNLVRDVKAEEHDEYHVQDYHDREENCTVQRLGDVSLASETEDRASIEPQSALEHYEKAVERESQGNLGDSLSHYRKAYRLDASVDKTYKNKYFPPCSSTNKPTLNPSEDSVGVPNTAHHSLDGPPASSISELIASCASAVIKHAPPETDKSPLAPCPISVIPSELLVEIILGTAVIDVASFARLSLICKKLAYLVATEDRIWQRICLGPEVGFGAMHFDWACGISGEPILHSLTMHSLSLSDKVTEGAKNLSNHLSFSLTPKYPNYRQMFRTRPRVRFHGCYISTVNYIRPGASSPGRITWNTPVLIVTYFRYLRFYRDGTCISLLTTSEPADVVHYLSREHLHSRHTSALPSNVMRDAKRGRWRLSGPNERYGGDSSPSKAIELGEPEGDLHIETEGTDPKYTFKMQLAFKSAGRSGGTRNNKLTWLGFWSYNKLADDWAEFSLRNDRAYFWSRVKSYGTG